MNIGLTVIRKSVNYKNGMVYFLLPNSVSPYSIYILH